MINLRRANERGHFNFGWLDTYHTFSFDQYYDPKHMSFRSLRVINEDRVAPGRGFPSHSHRDMEIVTYVLEGALRHQDSMGNGSVIRPGEVQRMTAGTGVTHSEANPSDNESLHLLQIWILPDKKNRQPEYEQKMFSKDEKQGRLLLIAANDGRNGAVTIHQDTQIYAALLDVGDSIKHELAPGRHAWIQVARGAVTLNEKPLDQGDGAAVSDEPLIEIVGQAPAEILLFDLA
ncbi:MAG TPA: pirin family protein [Pyrinomonadaceae bacterium]|nr:pirin family protein [Pyrinomonadaceae bacterium]